MEPLVTNNTILPKKYSLEFKGLSPHLLLEVRLIKDEGMHKRYVVSLVLRKTDQLKTRLICKFKFTRPLESLSSQSGFSTRSPSSTPPL